MNSDVWVRHRVRLVNLFLRKLFPNIPYEKALESYALKSN